MIRALAGAAAIALTIATGQALAQAAEKGVLKQADAKPDLARAQQIATQVCAACHAADGNSAASANPKLAAQFPDYLYKQLADFKGSEGKKPARTSPVMSAMVANLSEADMKNVAAYFGGQTLKPAVARDKELAARGQALWRAGNAQTGVPACAGCHGPAGAGIPGNFPRLGGQFAEYLQAQLEAFRGNARANDPNSMMRSIALRMSEGEIRAAAEYAAGLRP